MRSELRFVMHPEDEAALMNELLRDPAVLLVDGPRWKSAQPPATRSLIEVGRYCIIWSPEDLPELEADFIPTCDDWYCRSERATLQLLRSEVIDAVITDGRLAISTDPMQPGILENVEHRYRVLCRYIKKSYVNSVVVWRNVDRPEAPAGPSRSANPSAPDRSVWVGPAAMGWFSQHATRRIKQSLSGRVEGTVHPRPIIPAPARGARGRRA
jgi:hypothetical protein